MPADYIATVLGRARYEQLPHGEGIFAEIPGLPGVWANEDTVEDTREDLRLALESWIFVSLARGLPIPDIAEFGT